MPAHSTQICVIRGSCESSCNRTKQEFIPPTYFLGFSLPFVGIVYAILTVLIVGMYYVARRFTAGKKEEAPESDASKEKLFDKQEQ